MYQDLPRDQVPSGQLWNCVDFIPQYLGAPLRKRGGWSYASRALGSCTYVDALLYAPFAGAPLNLAVGSDGHVYKFTASAETDVGTAFAVAQNPVYHRSNAAGLAVILAASGSTTPKSYDGTTFQDLAGSPPQGIYGDVWNDRTLIANTAAQPQRLYFSPVGNAAGTWDTTNAWEDMKLPIVGVAVIRTGILLFHDHSTAVLTGTTPPSATSIGDLTLRDPVFDVGCIDARSIVKYNDTAIFAASRGIYQTDGNTIRSLTDMGGMGSYWATLLASYTTSWHISAGIYHDTYIVSVMNGTTFVDCLAYDLTWKFWYRLSNFPGRAFARQGGLFEETYMALGSSGRVASLSSILQPAAGVKNDANGTAVTPYYETAFFRGWQHWHRKWVPSMAIQSWRRAYLSYELTDAASDNPILTMSYATDLTASSYTALSPTLTENTSYKRIHRNVFTQGNGLMLKVAQTNASADTLLHAIEIEYTPLESSRLAQ